MPHLDYSTHIDEDFARHDLRRATLGGRYIGCDFSANDVTGADLCGDFTSCMFNATLHRAHQTGIFVHCKEVS